LLEGLTFEQAQRTVVEKGLRLRSIGDGSAVTDQLPAPGVTLAAGTEILVYRGAAPSTERETMPDLSGMRYEEARDALSYYGLYIQTNSPVRVGDEQRVGSQSVAPGTPLEHGAVVRVTLISGDDSLLGRY